MLCYNYTVILHRTLMYDAIILQILPIFEKRNMIWKFLKSERVLLCLKIPQF